MFGLSRGLGLGRRRRRVVNVLITRATRTGGAQHRDEHHAAHPQPRPSFHCFTSYVSVSFWLAAHVCERGTDIHE